MELTNEQIKNMTLDEAKRIIEENGFSDRGMLYRGCKQLYNWSYRHKLLEEIYGEQPVMERRKSKYDIVKVLPLLQRWAVEEDTTIMEQAKKYHYCTQWKDWCRENGVDINTKKTDLENEKEK